MTPRRALDFATGLAALGAVATFLVGLGAGLSEDPDYLFFWILAAVFAGIALLTDFARRRG